jgi:hypothetical protein
MLRDEERKRHAESRDMGGKSFKELSKKRKEMRSTISLET